MSDSAENMEQSEELNTRRSFRIGDFDGPLDLLWSMIRESKMNIYDIPISEITDQYLAFLDNCEKTDLSDLSDFYMWAAKLIYIKSRMLLPIEISYDDDEDEDPRSELVEKLIEYQKYKKLTLLMEEQEDDSEWNFERKRISRVVPGENPEEFWEEVDSWDMLQQLQEIFKRYVSQYSNEQIMNTFEEITVNEKITLMNELIEEKGECLFSQLITRSNNFLDVVCAFMAILEACKFKMVTIFQNRQYGDIKICMAHEEEGHVPTEEDLTIN